MQILISVVIVLILIAFGVSVPFCFLAGSFIFAWISGSSTGGFFNIAFHSIESQTMLAIPLFLAGGVLMEKSGIAKTLVDLGEMLMKRVKGGLGAAIPVVSCFFGALCGSGSATVSTLATMMAPTMEEKGWDKRYLAALIAACGPLGYMIPPNMNAIMFAGVSSASVAALFLATLVPGILWAIAYIVMNRIVYTRWYHPVEAVTAGVKENGGTFTPEGMVVNEPSRWTVVRKAIPALLMPVIVLGGIYGGVFTATEAGSIGCLYGVIIGMIYYRNMNGKAVFSVFRETGETVGNIMIIFPMVLIFSRLLILNGIPSILQNFILSISSSRVVILLVIDLILVISGCFLDVPVLILLYTPLLTPTMHMLGVSDVQFGVMMMVAIGIGTLTPPIAMHLFIVGRMLNVTIKDIWTPLWPMLLFICVPILLLVTFVPALSTFLPSLLV